MSLAIPRCVGSKNLRESVCNIKRVRHSKRATTHFSGFNLRIGPNGEHFKTQKILCKDNFAKSNLLSSEHLRNVKRGELGALKQAPTSLDSICRWDSHRKRNTFKNQNSFKDNFCKIKFIKLFRTIVEHGESSYSNLSISASICVVSNSLEKEPKRSRALARCFSRNTLRSKSTKHAGGSYPQ